MTHEHINLLLTRLDCQQKRWYAATLAEQYGLRKVGVGVLAQITGISEKTIRQGIHEMMNGLAGILEWRTLRPSAGRPMVRTCSEIAKGSRV